MGGRKNIICNFYQNCPLSVHIMLTHLSCLSPVPYLAKDTVVFRGSLEFQKWPYFDQSISSNAVEHFFLSSANNILMPEFSLRRKKASH